MDFGFVHFLVTRFNIEYKDYVKKKLNITPELWLEERVELFFDYCYPSVTNQTNKNFKWIVYFDSLTPIETLSYVKGKDICNVIKFGFVDKFEQTIKQLTEDIGLLTNERSDYVMTTRLDNDDMLSAHAIHTIQESFASLKEKKLKEKFSINLTDGLVYDVSSKMFFSIKGYYSNPFITLIEPIDNFQSVYHIEHKKISGISNTTNLAHNYYFVQMVHGNNLWNSIKGKPVVWSLKRIGACFPSNTIRVANFYQRVQFALSWYFFKIKKRII